MLQVALQLDLNVFSWVGTYDSVGFLSILEYEQGGNAHGVKAHRRRLILVDVQLSEGDLARVFLREFLNDRFNHSAGTAPSGPEVDYRVGMLGCKRLEGGISHYDGL